MASLTGAMGGAGTGATIGSAFGPIGTGVGAAIGGLVGLFGGGGGNKPNEWQRQANQGLIDTAALQKQREAEAYARFLEYINPVVSRYKALTGPNNDVAAIQAAMPEMAKYSQGYAAAKANIMNSMPPGAMREKALADLDSQRVMGMATAQGAAVASAPDALAQIGGLFQTEALQRTGAGINAYQTVLQGATAQRAQDAQANQSKLNFFSNLASTVGGMVKSGGNKPMSENPSIASSFSLPSTAERPPFSSYVLPRSNGAGAYGNASISW